MSPYYFLAFILLCCGNTPAKSTLTTPTATNPEKIAKILTLARNFRILNEIPGFGLTVVHNNNVTGDIVIAEGFGFGDLDLQLEANNQTLFPLNSASKGFSATMIIKILHDKFPELGEFVLDTPIKKLAPTFDFVLSDRYRTEFVTFRDLLAMRVCIGSSGGLSELFASFPSKEDFYYRLRYYNETCSFRNGFEYSNALYGLAGEIAAHLSNSTVEEIVINFMTELGMNNSTFFDAEGRYETLPNIAKGYYKRFGVINQFDNKMLKKASIVLTAGAMLVTQEDMVKYINFHLNKGRVVDRQVMPEEVLSWLYTVSNPKAYMSQPMGRKTDEDNVEGIYGYGLGHILSLYDGYTKIGHGGFYRPYNSQFFFYPDLNIGIFTVSNGPGPTGSETGYTQEIFQSHIYKILREKDVDISSDLKKISMRSSSVLPGHFNDELDLNWTNGFQPQKLPQKPTFTERLAKTDIVGLYGNADTGDIIIHLSEERHLLMNFGEYATNGKMERKGDSNSTFSIEWATSIMQNFYHYGDLFVAKFAAHFLNENEFRFEFGSNIGESIFITFRKNATVDTFPKIPWKEGDCGPEP